MTTPEPCQPSAFAWQPPGWLQALLNMLQSLLGWGAGITSMICCMVFVHHWLPQLSFLGIVLTPLLGLPTLAIHEWGHVVGARAAGMTVSYVVVGPIQLLAQRRGWRVRWQRLKKKTAVHGLVMAYPDTDRPMRGAYMLMTAAGPAANLLIGLVAVAITLALGDSAFGWIAAGVAALNLAVGLANLIPTSREMASDGLLMLQWLQCKNEHTPELHFIHLNALCIKGVPAEDLPSDRVDALADMPAPMPLVHSWFVLKQHQNTGAWKEGALLASLMEERIAAIPDAWRPSFDGLISSLRCEMRFTQSMAGLSDEVTIDHELSAECDWLSPWLRPRCRALVAARAGDETSARVHLEEARHWAERSVDRALEKSEAVLAQAILSRLGTIGFNSVPGSKLAALAPA